MLLHEDRLRGWSPEDWPVEAGWAPVVQQFLASDAGAALGSFLKSRIAAGAVVYPPTPFEALAATALQDVRVVILGQDPYHGPGQAHGLAFSVPAVVRVPPSLRNILAEVDRDCTLAGAVGALVGTPSGSLLGWAQQGVLLLNTCLTVEEGQPASHANRGWEVLTDAILGAVLARTQPVVCMLWGAHAQAKSPLVEASRARGPRLVLCANHPSPLSARRPPVPFLGCGHFSRANAFLVAQGLTAVSWASRAGVVN